jgi:peptidyl-prolyl cis-trans isomerase C
MQIIKLFKHHLIAVVLLAATQSHASADARAGDEQILATVGDLTVTASDLRSAMASSPFATQFPSMERGDQAALRGTLVQRLVVSRLLYLEAERLGLEQSERFKTELENFRLGLLYRHYMDRLREQLTLPAELSASMQQQLGNDPDALAGARSAWLADSYRNIRYLTIQQLRDKYKVVLFEDRIVPGRIQPDTLLLEGNGIQIRYADIVRNQPSAPSNPGWIKNQLYKRAEMMVVAKAAEEEGVDVSEWVASFARERLPAMLIEQKQQEWAGDEATLRAFFEKNPQLGRIQERRHIGQLVVASREQAEALREQILNGKSLFELAAEHSIDPYGKARSGDMGWIKEGSGHPAIEQALQGLEDEQVSAVIETPLGYHLVTILERRPGGQKIFASIRDKVRQALIAQRMASYTTELEARYKVVWNLVDKQQAKPE